MMEHWTRVLSKRLNKKIVGGGVVVAGFLAGGVLPAAEVRPATVRRAASGGKGRA